MSDVPLKEYVESQIKWLQDYHESQIKWIDKHFDVQLEAIGKAESLALTRLNERLAGMNEFRDTLRDQAGNLATRVEVQSLHKSTDDRLKILETNKAGLDGKILIITTLAAIIASGIVTFVLQHLKLA